MFSTFIRRISDASEKDSRKPSISVSLVPESCGGEAEQESGWKSTLRRFSNAITLSGIPEIPIFTPGEFSPKKKRRRYAYRSSSDDSTSGGNKDSSDDKRTRQTSHNLLSSRVRRRQSSNLSMCKKTSISKIVVPSDQYQDNPVSPNPRVGRQVRLTRKRFNCTLYPHTQEISTILYQEQLYQMNEKVTDKTKSLPRYSQDATNCDSLFAHQYPFKESMYWMAFASEQGSSRQSEFSSTSDEDEVPAYRRNIKRPQKPFVEPKLSSIHRPSDTSLRFFCQRPSIDSEINQLKTDRARLSTDSSAHPRMPGHLTLGIPDNHIVYKQSSSSVLVGASTQSSCSSPLYSRHTPQNSKRSSPHRGSRSSPHRGSRSSPRRGSRRKSYLRSGTIGEMGISILYDIGRFGEHRRPLLTRCIIDGQLARFKTESMTCKQGIPVEGDEIGRISNTNIGPETNSLPNGYINTGTISCSHCRCELDEFQLHVHDWQRTSTPQYMAPSAVIYFSSPDGCT